MSRLKWLSGVLFVASLFLSVGVWASQRDGLQAVEDSQADQILGGGCGWGVDVDMTLSCPGTVFSKGSSQEQCPAAWFLKFSGPSCSGHVMTIETSPCESPCGRFCGGYKGQIGQVCICT